MTRFHAVPACFICVVAVTLALSLPRAPRAAAAHEPLLPRSVFTDRDLIKRATEVCGLLVDRPESVQVFLAPRPIRERNGAYANAVDVYCHDNAGQMIGYMTWDTVTGDLLIFSRADVQHLKPRSQADRRECAESTALNWLAMTRLSPANRNWRVTSAVRRSDKRWIVRASCGDRLAAVSVDRSTGAVIGMTTWRDWPESMRGHRVASNEGGRRAARRRNSA